MWSPEAYREKLVEEKPVKVELQPLAIGTPFYYSFHFLDEYIQALVKLDYPKELLSLYFPVQGEDDTYDMLQIFKDNYAGKYASINMAKRPDITEAKNYWHLLHLNVCAQRNWILEQSKPQDVLFIGHDNFCPPNTVNRLLEGKALGADIIAGVYPFLWEGGLAFTSFFKLKNGEHDTGLHDIKKKMWFPDCLYGHRAWTYTTGMDATLVRRKVLDAIPFQCDADRGEQGWSDDVEFCYSAQQKGFTVMTDYGLFVRHWGFDVQFLPPPKNGWIQVRATFTSMLHQRRQLIKKMRMETCNFSPQA